MQICTYHADKIGLINFMSVLLWSSTLCNIVQNGINIISFIICY